ncbi:dihydropteroate synthase [Euzebya sp.]|uniref:dihydropteroate synthase n=1 Tax=Euzebya sp. TaxID=1971409 RepID=UPI0035133CE6
MSSVPPPPAPLVRIVDASLGSDTQVKLVVSRVSKPDRLRSAWSSSGAVIERVGDRIHATSTVEALARAAGRSLDRDEAGALDRALREAVAAWTGVAPALRARGRTLPTDQRPLVMGIVNVTPDSFSDGGALYPDGHPGRAIDRARELVAAGADVVDVGGESTRPGAQPVSAEEELSRILPVVRALISDGTCVSIDTRKADVARAALKEGAQIVNDVGAAADDDLVAEAARTGAVYVLMHSRSTPADMADHADYEDVVAEVYEFLVDTLRRCESLGLSREQVVVDPGIGFAKTAEHNLQLLRAVPQFRSLGRPVLIGASRKSFLATVSGAESMAERMSGSLAVAALATAAGAAFVRVHDVAETVRAVRTARAVAAGQTDWAPLTR